MGRTNKNPLHSLYYHITNNCNLRCKHCWVKSGEAKSNDELCLHDAIGIVEQCIQLGLVNVKLTGGEPLLVPWVIDYIRYLSDKKIKVTIETNGTLITKELAKKLKDCGNVSQISISLDGSNSASHEYLRSVPGCFDKTISGIKNLIEIGIIPMLMTAVHKGNQDELEDIAMLASSLGVGAIKLNCVHGTGRGEGMVSYGETLNEQEKLELFDSLDEIEQKTKIEFQLSIPFALKPLSKMNRHRAGGCNVLNTLGLLPNGDLGLCGIALTTPELNFGNFRAHSVAEIWNENPIIRQLDEGLPEKLEGVCAQCAFKLVCRGGCRAEAFCCSGSVLSPCKMCQWAKEHGSFPAARLNPVGV